MKHHILLLLLTFAALLPACSHISATNPPNGAKVSVTSMGGDIDDFTSEAFSFGKMNNSNGLAHATTMAKDLTKIVVTGDVTKSASKDLLGGLRTTEGTKRVINNNATSVKLGKQAADVEKARILNPVELAPVAP